MKEEDILAGLDELLVFLDNESGEAPEVPNAPPKQILFPGILPDPLEPNEQVLAMGVVDLRSLRSGLHLLHLQLTVAIASVEQLEYAQLKVQEMVKQKEGKNA